MGHKELLLLCAAGFLTISGSCIRESLFKKKKKKEVPKRDKAFFYFTFEQNRLLLNLYYMHICIDLRFRF